MDFLMLMRRLSGNIQLTIFFVAIKIITIPVKSIDISWIVDYHVTDGCVPSIAPTTIYTHTTRIAWVTKRGRDVGHTEVSLKVKNTYGWNVERHHGNIAKSCRVFEFIVASLLPSPIKHINERMNGKENRIIGPSSGGHIPTDVAVKVADIALQTHAHLGVVIAGQGQGELHHGGDLYGGVEAPHYAGLPATGASEAVVRDTATQTGAVTTEEIWLPEDGLRKITHVRCEIKIRQGDTTVHLLKLLLHFSQKNSMPGQEVGPSIGMHSMSHV